MNNDKLSEAAKEYLQNLGIDEDLPIDIQYTFGGDQSIDIVKLLVNFASSQPVTTTPVEQQEESFQSVRSKAVETYNQFCKQQSPLAWHIWKQAFHLGHAAKQSTKESILVEALEKIRFLICEETDYTSYQLEEEIKNISTEALNNYKQ